MSGDTHYIVGGGDCGFVRIIDCRLCFFVPTQETTKLMLTVVALTMALTPFMEGRLVQRLLNDSRERKIKTSFHNDTRIKLLEFRLHNERQYKLKTFMKLR